MKGTRAARRRTNRRARKRFVNLATAPRIGRLATEVSGFTRTSLDYRRGTPVGPSFGGETTEMMLVAPRTTREFGGDSVLSTNACQTLSYLAGVERLLLAERGYGQLQVIENFEKAQHAHQLENLHHKFGGVQQLQGASTLLGGGEVAHQKANGARIDHGHFL